MTTILYGDRIRNVKGTFCRRNRRNRKWGTRTGDRMKFPKLRSASQLLNLVEDIGFLPFFHNETEGFSVEECTPDGYWFVEGVEGPWDWKSEIAQGKKAAYGKFFHGKAGYVSAEWFPYLSNYRRDGYDFDSRYDDGLSSRQDKNIITYLSEHGGVLSTEIREALNYGKNGNKGFDTVITRLQMQTYILPQSFEYKKDRKGREYGWGVARYTLSEDWLGRKACRSRYKEDPQTSFRKMLDRLEDILPDADEEQLIRLLQ